MVAWRVAKSLDVLLAQFNAACPNRSKLSDGSIGDAAHQTRDSDHNPWVDIPGEAQNAVTARDFTHDPAHGMDIDEITDQLEASRDPRIKYVIANRLIMSGAGGPSPWIWRDYYGPNPHTKHFHLSVVAVPALFDSTEPWHLAMFEGLPTVTDHRLLMLTDPYMEGDDIKTIQRVLNAWYEATVPRPDWYSLAEDGIFGPVTESAVKYLQTRARITVDGIVGPQTRGVLGF